MKKKKVLIGIDPGATGAIAILANSLEIFNLSGKSSKEIFEFLSKQKNCKIAIEEVSPSFRGVAYNKARESYMQIKTICELLPHPFETFRPCTRNGWMRVWSADIKAEKPKTQKAKKARSLRFLNQAHPELASSVKTHDEADATCLALLLKTFE